MENRNLQSVIKAQEQTVPKPELPIVQQKSKAQCNYADLRARGLDNMFKMCDPGDNEWGDTGLARLSALEHLWDTEFQKKLAGSQMQHNRDRIKKYQKKACS